MTRYSGVWLKLLNLFVLLQRMFQLKKLKSDSVEISDETEMPDQVAVPYVVLELLIDYIPNYADHLSFKSVCKLWHLVESKHPGLPAVLPWLMLPSSDGTCKFYEICSRNYYRNPIHKVDSGAVYYGSYCDGWIFCISDSPKRFFLNNIYSGEKRLLPSKTNVFSLPDLSEPCSLPACVGSNMLCVDIVKTVFSCSPSSKGYLAASINHQGCALTIFEPDSNDSLATTVHLGGKGLLCIIFYNDMLLGVDKLKMVHSFIVGENENGLAQVLSFEKLKTKKFDLPLSSFPNRSTNTYHSTHLVEISGKVLMVLRYYGGFGPSNTYTNCFKVFELVWNCPLEWVEVKSLQGYAIFLDNYVARAFHASHFPGIKGDHIYFASSCGLFDTGVFSVRDQSTGLILPPEDFSDHAEQMWLFPPNCQLEQTKNTEDEKSVTEEV